MTFGVNPITFSHVTKYPSYVGVHFKVGNRITFVNVTNLTSERWKANLLWALGINQKVPSDKVDFGRLLYDHAHYGMELFAFFHYHATLEDKAYTFLHIPGTFDDGVVFDRKGQYNYQPYIDADGSLVFVDFSTKDRSLIKRTKEYMESAHVKPQGILTIHN